MFGFERLIRVYLPEPHASLLAGITFGSKLRVEPSFYQSLIDAGMIHIAVLSGMNISIISHIILKSLSPAIGIRLSTICTVVIISLYAFYSGAQPPAVRAALMASVVHVGILFGRKTYTIYTFFLTVIIMILFDATLITSLSFQLTCGATLGIVLFAGDQQDDEEVHLQSRQRTIATFLLRELRTSAAAQLCTLPLIFWNFGRISLIGTLANLCIGWLIAPVMVMGLLTSFFGSICFVCGWPFARIAYGMIHVLVMVAEIAAHIPFAAVRF